ncbi:MAG: type VI secretion system tip protein VgrG [Azonexaceae bacterium]|nr:type VI secretion system tip protein VgrG [Azonexaceae bacterium]
MQALLSDLFTQHARLLEIKTALPDAALIVERFSGREALSEPFRFDIDCISTNAHFELDALNATEVTLLLLQADGSKRAWHGYVTHAMQLGADGGLARYRLVVESFLAFLDHRWDCYLFQDKTVVDIVGQILADYPEAHWKNEITQPLRTHSIATQYRESDLEFIARLLADEGLAFRFEHDQTACAGDGATHARHQWVLFDRQAELPAGRQAALRFHRSHATEATDTVQVWREAHHTRPNLFSLAGWDYKSLTATAAQADSTLAPEHLPRLEIHDAGRAYRFEDADAARLRTDLALAAHEAAYRRFAADGAVRQLAEGTVVTLEQHAAHPAPNNRFTVVAVDHEGANNLGAMAAHLLANTDVEAGTYRNRFLVQPAHLPFIPEALPKPTIRPQVALIVGLPDQPLTTERDHRVKIQFDWQRGPSPNPGGLADTGPEQRAAGKRGNARGNDQSGTWVRVAEWLSGPNWGSHFLPRTNTEVLVDFVDGDIDRPFITGQNYNGADEPPFAAGHEAGANHPGVLAGWNSHNHRDGFNQWLVDDAPGQLRSRLAASENATQFALGHLVHQSPAAATRGAWRGSGFELRSDAWLALRATDGILLSATARTDAQSTQLDAAEAVAQVRAAEQTAQALSGAAHGQQALPLQANPVQTTLLTAVDPLQDGKFTAPAGGQETRKASPTGRDLADPAERLAKPAILAEAPADIALTTPANTVLFAAAHLHATAQQDFQLTAAHTLAVSAGKAASLFAHAGGIKSVAQAGSHTLHAHTGRMEILADQAIAVTSSNDDIHLLAKNRITLQAGQSAVTLEGQNITFACPGKFSVKGAGNAFLGPGKGKAGLERLPDSRVQLFHEQFKAVDEQSGNIVANQPYRIELADGSEIRGVTDEFGKTTMVMTPDSQSAKLYWENLPPVDASFTDDGLDEGC